MIGLSISFTLLVLIFHLANAEYYRYIKGKSVFSEAPCANCGIKGGLKIQVEKGCFCLLGLPFWPVDSYYNCKCIHCGSESYDIDVDEKIESRLKFSFKFYIGTFITLSVFCAISYFSLNYYFEEKNAKDYKERNKWTRFDNMILEVDLSNKKYAMILVEKNTKDSIYYNYKIYTEVGSVRETTMNLSRLTPDTAYFVAATQQDFENFLAQDSIYVYKRYSLENDVRNRIK